MPGLRPRRPETPGTRLAVMHRRSHVRPYEGAVTLTPARLAPMHTPSHSVMVTELPTRPAEHGERAVTADADNPIQPGLPINTHGHADLETIFCEHFFCSLVHAGSLRCLRDRLNGTDEPPHSSNDPGKLRRG